MGKCLRIKEVVPFRSLMWIGESVGLSLLRAPQIKQGFRSTCRAIGKGPEVTICAICIAVLVHNKWMDKPHLTQNRDL